MFDKDGIVLKPLLDEDIPLFDRWLNKDYIYKWLCPDGEEQREAWLDEVDNRNGKYGFIRHFIVYYKDKKIGYCLFADCFFFSDVSLENIIFYVFTYEKADGIHAKVLLSGIFYSHFSFRLLFLRLEKMGVWYSAAYYLFAVPCIPDTD